MNLEEAVLKVTQKEIKDINSEWIHFYKLKYFSAVKGRQYERNYGTRITDHPDDYSSRNIAPAVSPDGKKIAYLTDGSIYGSVMIAELGKKKVKKVLSIYNGNPGFLYEGISLSANTLSWSSDGKSIMLILKRKGRDTICFID